MQLVNATSFLSILFDSQHAETVKFSGMAFELQWMQFYKICIRIHLIIAPLLVWILQWQYICRVRCRGFLRHLRHHWLDYVEKSHHRDQVLGICAMVLHSVIQRLDSAGDVILPQQNYPKDDENYQGYAGTGLAVMNRWGKLSQYAARTVVWCNVTLTRWPWWVPSSSRWSD